MKWTEVPAGKINAANQRLWVELGDSAEEVANRINTDPSFVQHITQMMINSGYTESKSQKIAREIMGKNFFGIKEAIKYFGVNPLKEDFDYLTNVPFTEEMLNSCKNTHVLVAVFPLSILDIRRHTSKHSDQTLFDSQDWYMNKEFIQQKQHYCYWMLIRKGPIEGSIAKIRKDQRALLSEDEDTLRANILVYTIIGHFLSSGERLFEEILVRATNNPSEEFQYAYVNIGYFDVNGLRINASNCLDSNDNLGMAAAKKMGQRKLCLA